MTELVNRLQSVLDRQHTINRATGQVAVSNLMVNIVNHVRNRQLAVQIHASKQKITQLQSNIHELESAVSSLGTDVDVQKSISNRLKSSLDATRNLLENTINNYRDEMSKQRKILDEQQQALNIVRRNSFNQKFIADISLLIASIYVAGTPLFSYPMDLVSKAFARLLPITHKLSHRRKIVKSLIRLVTILWMMNWGKRTLESYGIYNSFQGYTGYIQEYFSRGQIPAPKQEEPSPPS